MGGHGSFPLDGGRRRTGHGVASATSRDTDHVPDPRDPIDRSALQVASARWLEALTVGSGEGVALLAGDGTIRYFSVSGTLCALLGYEPEELHGMVGPGLVHADDRVMLQRAFLEVAREQRGQRTVDYRVRHKLGHFVRVQSTGVNRLDDEVVGAIVVHTRGASVSSVPPSDDPASSLRDKPAFMAAVEQAIIKARTDPSYGFSVLIIELTRMKMLLGSYGQEVVDELMAKASARVTGLLRPGDTLGGFGREIAVLLDGVQDRRHAARVADRIQRVVGQRYEVGEHTIDTSAIVGIATSERIYERAADVLRDAALATNRARGRGRKRRAVFQTQMRVEDTRFMAMVSELHSAIKESQFRLHYQPIVSLATRTLSGFEALVRWEHPERGLVSPDQFIPVAEDTGLIEPLGRWVLEEACRQMVEWRRQHPQASPLQVSVNLSNKQFADEDLEARVAKILADTGLEADRLKLEVTESAILENQDEAAKVLGRLKAHGVRVSLDDFGTGYSSFSYLCSLPYDTLKIDRSFVSRIGEEGENTDVIHAIIVLAHNLRMEVVAEGVENEIQATQLKSMWCEYAQGFHFARPLPASEASALIASSPQW
ncbi:MAG TPA: EAL domain-containing protein [Polyangiaceae bacterium]|nr:EAL domain-containing protein [Polyangiaceae bacterium]